jgi:hypothetical protein
MRSAPLLSRLCLLVAACSAGTGYGSQAVTQVILPARPIVVETHVDARFSAETVMPALREVLGREKTFAILNLEERGLSEDDRAVLIVPVFTSLRVSRTLKAGSILEVVAHVAGGLWVIDPWTNTVLYSATRLVMYPVAVAASARDREDTLIRTAFLDAIWRWTETCVQQLQRDANPFVVDGLTGAVPSAAKSTSGIWLRGRVHGIREGVVIGSDQRELARVETVFEKFSVISEVADPKRRIPEGRRYRALVVSSPINRPEPRISIALLSDDPVGAPESADALGPAAMLDIVQMYAAKEGGLRVLPSLSGGVDSSEALRELSEAVSRHAKLASTDSGLTVHRQTLLQRATESPDLYGEVTTLREFHGVRTMPDGRSEHLFSVTLLGTLGIPQAPELSWALARTVEVTEEIAVVEMSGIREITPADLWFTVRRNASISLGKKMQEAALRILQTNGGGYSEGKVGPNGVPTWPNPKPSSATLLTWLRPAGEVSGPDSGGRLGVLMERLSPSLGFLNPRSLAGEKVRPGDVLRYRSGEQSLPAIPLVLSGPASGGGLGMPGLVVSRIAAGALVETLPIRILVPSSGELPPNTIGLEVILEIPRIEQTASTSTITGECRLRLWPSLGQRQGEPSLKAGVAYTEESTFDTTKPHLTPRDTGGELNEWTSQALKKAISRGKEKGLIDAMDGSVQARKGDT